MNLKMSSKAASPQCLGNNAGHHLFPFQTRFSLKGVKMRILAFLCQDLLILRTKEGPGGATGTPTVS